MVKPNSITLAGSLRTGSEHASKLDDRPNFSSNQLRTSSEPTSVMEFGFFDTQTHVQKTFISCSKKHNIRTLKHCRERSHFLAAE